ncbi:MAG: neuraminidase-like domain-containing protein [Bacteroidota bacterium]
MNFNQLRKGNRNKTVTALHNTLQRLGIRINRLELIQGHFGNSTEQAIRTFQTSHRLRASGRMNAATAKALESIHAYLFDRSGQLKVFAVKGKIVQETGKVVPDAKVELWALQEDNEVYLKKFAITDNKGSFTINITGPELIVLLKRALPRIFFKVFLGETLIKDTRVDVVWSPDTGNAVLEIVVAPIENQEQWTLKGLVKNQKGANLQGLGVKAIDKNSGLALGQATTGRTGRYQITFTSQKFSSRKFAADYKPTVYFKIFEGAKEIHNTIDQPIDQLEPGPYANDLHLPKSSEEEPLTKTLKGRVFLDNRLPAKNVELKLYQKGFGGDTLLTKIQTDDNGYYQFDYELTDKNLSYDIRTNDDRGEEFQLSNAKFNADATETQNLIAPAKIKPSAPEYQRLLSDIQPQLGGRPLREAEENENRTDISFLFQQTGWDARLISTAAMADQKSEETGLEADSLYALFRLGMPTGAKQLARVGMAGIEKALRKANEAGIANVNVEASKNAYAAFALQTLRNEKATGGLATVNTFFENAAISEEDAAKMAHVFFNEKWSGAELWDKAAEADVSDLGIALLRNQGKLAFLTMNNPKLSVRLERELMRNNERAAGVPALEMSQLAEQGYYKPSTWVNTMRDLTDDDPDQLARSIPSAFAEENVEDRLQAYAVDMARKVRAAYPTESLAAMVGNDDLVLGEQHETMKTSVQRMLLNSARLQVNGSGDYVPGSASFNAMVRDHREDMTAGIPAEQVNDTLNSAKTLTRLYQLSPTDEATQILYDLGIESAFDIVHYPFDDWMRYYGPRFPNFRIAEMIYRKSEQTTTVIYNFYTAAEQLDSAPLIPVSSPAPELVETTKNNLIQQFPTLETLFGSLDFCECKHCRSVLSPAAYLVDILKFLDPGDAAWNRNLELWRERHDNNDYPGLKAFDALMERRPDLAKIQLTCANTLTAMPYIDIVNEILECYVDKENLDELVAYDTGEATTAELLAEPQNIVQGAYHKLSASVYPLTLPFDLSLKTVRAFCQHFDVPYWQLLHDFRQNNLLFSDGGGNHYFLNDIFIEQMKMDATTYRLFADPDFSNWFQLYGYTSESEALTVATDDETLQRIDLLSAKTLSRRLGINYNELVSLVKSRFLNPQLSQLTILRTVDISIEDVFRWKSASGYPPFTAEELAVFTGKLDEASEKFTFDATAWLNQFWEANTFEQIIVIYDPNAGCNFDEASLRFANGDQLSSLEWMKLNLLVRLWKQLDWKLEDLDAALVNFMPKDSPVDPSNLGEKFQTALIYLAHLTQLHNNYKLGKHSLQNWTGLWGGLTNGEHSIYKRLFLSYSILREDDIFDDPLGNYLAYLDGGTFEPFFWDPEQPEDRSAGNVGLINHMIAVQAGLELTKEEIQVILESNEPALTIETAPLNMEIIQLFYGYYIMREASKLSIAEQISLEKLSGLDPRKALEPGVINTLDQDHPYGQTLKFLSLVDQIKNAGFSLADLDYLVRHYFDPVGPYQESETTAVNLIRTLAIEIQQIKSELNPPNDPAAFTIELLQERLLQALSPDIADMFMNMWNGTAQFGASFSATPADRIPVDLLPERDELFFSYNEVRQVQTLLYTGVLDTGQKNELEDHINNLPGSTLTDDQKTLVVNLLNDIHDQSATFYTEHILKPILQDDPAQTFDPFFPIVDTTLDDEEQEKMKAEKLEVLLVATLDYLSKKFTEDYLVAALSDLFGMEAPELKFLLQTPGVLSFNGRNLQSTFEEVDRSGVLISFVQDESTGTQAGPSLRRPTAELAASEIPTGTTLVRIQGYLECQVAEAYRFFIGGANPGTEVALSFDHLEEPLIAETIAANGAEVSGFTELEANRPYQFLCTIRDFNDGTISLKTQSDSLTKSSLDKLRLYPQDLVLQIHRAATLLKKCIQIIQTLVLSQTEVKYLSEHPDHFYQFDFSSVPTSLLDGPGNDAAIVELFGNIMKLDRYVQLRQILAGGSGDLAAMLSKITDDQPATLDLIAEELAVLTRRNPETIRSVFQHFGYSALDIVREDTLTNVWEILGHLHALRVPLETLDEVTTVVSKTTDHATRYPLAASFKQAIKSRYSLDNWNRIAQSIFDKLRPQQRDALVDYILHQDGFARREELFAYLLVDPGMEPVVQTSRIRLAISSVQTFVQRCLLNLEKKVSPFMLSRNHWEWMKRYRVWEANRKIFLWPENWLEPEFRDDKTHLFQELESSLMQGDINADVVERAFYDYLKGLQKIARLNMVAMYCEEDPVSLAGNTLHVIGKSFTQPEYYYRNYRNNMWTPWVPVPTQIEGEHLALIKWRDRLHIFWVTFMLKAKSIAGKTESVESTSTKNRSQLMSHSVEVALNWCEYFQGEWQARETSGFEHPLKAQVDYDFDPAEVYIHASIEYDDDGQERAVKVHLTGNGRNGINRAFRLVSKLATPKAGPSYHNDPAAPLYNFDKKGKTKYIGQGSDLKVTYKQRITEIVETTNGRIDLEETTSVPKNETLLRVNDTFKFLFCNDPIIVSGDQEIDSLISPFFLEDDEDSITMYVEPEFSETTTETWEEWIIREQPPTLVYERDDYYEFIPVIPFIPYENFRDFEDYFDLEINDPLIRFAPDEVINPGDDWLINPGTAMLFNGQPVGPRGGLNVTPKDAGTILLTDDLAGTIKDPRGTLVDVAPGSELAAGQSVFVNEFPSVAQGNEFGLAGGLGDNVTTLHIVGENGLNETSFGQFGAFEQLGGIR